MFLESLTIRNLRCHANLSDILFHPLTIFIGENDAGKTCITDAIKFLLEAEVPSELYYKKISDECVEDTITISGTFSLSENDTLPDSYRCIVSNKLVLTKTFLLNQPVKCEVVGLAFEDERINTFSTQSAGVQKEILEKLGFDAQKSNPATRQDALQQALADGRLQQQSKTLLVKFSDVKPHLPLFQRISSNEYQQPDSLVQRVLRLAVEDCLSPTDEQTGEKKPRPDLIEIKNLVAQTMNECIAQVKEPLQNYNNKLRDVRVAEPNIDFSRGVSIPPIILDIEGQPAGPLETFGDGTRKKTWLGLLEWERKVRQEIERSIILIYDEPDVNLDYASERKLFDSICSVPQGAGSKTQTIVCTHAVTFIDRAPASSINYVHVGENGKRSLKSLSSDGDADVRDFLNVVGRGMGIPNSALFYEKAFLIVEGPTEENALPLLYRHLYNRSLVEDGIFLINLEGNGSWSALLKILSNHKSRVTTLFLDQDSTCEDSGCNINLSKLQDIGFPSDFLKENCVFIGDSEFEDAFRTEDIIQVANTHWPRKDGQLWQKQDFDTLRKQKFKFSKELCRHIYANCADEFRPVRKPELGKHLGAFCTSPTQIPQAIHQVFEKVRTQAGCFNS